MNIIAPALSTQDESGRIPHAVAGQERAGDAVEDVREIIAGKRDMSTPEQISQYMSLRALNQEACNRQLSGVIYEANQEEIHEFYFRH